MESWEVFEEVVFPWAVSWSQCQWLAHSEDFFWKTRWQCGQRMLFRRQKFSWSIMVRVGMYWRQFLHCWVSALGISVSSSVSRMMGVLDEPFMVVLGRDLNAKENFRGVESSSDGRA